MAEMSQVAFTSKENRWPLDGITFEMILSFPNGTTRHHWAGPFTTGSLQWFYLLFFTVHYGK